MERELRDTKARVRELETQVASLRAAIDDDPGVREGDGTSTEWNGDGLAGGADDGFGDALAALDEAGHGGARTEPDRSEHVAAELSAERRQLVDGIRRRIETLDEIPRGMLAYYREYGPASPRAAHLAAGGTGDRTEAYRHNGALRAADLIDHTGRGTYRPRIRSEIRDAHDGDLDAEAVDRVVHAVEEVLPPARPPATVEDWPEP